MVGVSTTEGGLAAMRFACAEARIRKVGLRAVRSWADEGWTLVGADAAISTLDEWERGQRELVNNWLTLARIDFPDVHIETELVSEPVYWELEKYVGSASLLVLGCRRSDDTRIPRIGPIAAWAVREARCPVAIVGHEQGREYRPADASTSIAEVT